MTGPGHDSFGVVEGRVWFAHFIGQFLESLVHVQSHKKVSDKTTTSWVVSGLTIGRVGDGSVRVSYGTSLADMTIE